MPRNAFRRLSRYDETPQDVGAVAGRNNMLSRDAVLPDLSMVEDQSDNEKGFIGGLIRSGISLSSKPDMKEPASPATSGSAVLSGAPKTSPGTVGNSPRTAGRFAFGGTRAPDNTQKEFGNLVQDQSASNTGKASDRVSIAGTAIKAVVSYFTGGLLQGVLQGIGQGVSQGIGQGVAKGATQGIAKGAIEGTTKGLALQGVGEGLASAGGKIASTAADGLSDVFNLANTPLADALSKPYQELGPHLSDASFTPEYSAAYRTPTFGETMLDRLGRSAQSAIGISDQTVGLFKAGEYGKALGRGTAEFGADQLESRIGGHKGSAKPPEINMSFPRVAAPYRKNEEGEGEPRRVGRPGSRRFQRN